MMHEARYRMQDSYAVGADATISLNRARSRDRRDIFDNLIGCFFLS
jgi:hypothetical protein